MNANETLVLNALEIKDLVAAPSCTVACIPLDGIELGEMGEKDGRAFIRLALHAGTKAEIAALIGQISDAAQVQGVKATKTTKGGRAISARWAPTYHFSPMDYHAEMKLWA